MIMCGTLTPAHTSDLPRSRGSIPGASGDALPFRQALMKHPPIAVVGLPDEFVSANDEGLFAFISTLRLSVKAKVEADQQRGLSLAEIVVQVREMVRIARENTVQQNPFPSRAFRAISREAIAWCVETYRPLVITAGDDLSAAPNRGDPKLLPATMTPAKPSAGRFPAQSPPYRGLP